MAKPKGKKAIISVDYLSNQKLHLGDPVIVLEKKKEKFFLGTRNAVKVKSTLRPSVDSWIFESELIYIKEK